MSDNTVLFTRDGGIARVQLNRPEKLNAITDEMDRALHDAWVAINDDDTIACVVLSGAGDRAFCVGADISGQRTDNGTMAFGGGLTGVGGPLLTLRKPLIAAVHGYCLGGGFELAMCADIIIAADNCVFGLPETKIGVIAHCGVVHRAARRLPLSIAMGMILADERLLADQAKMHGLANSVVAPFELADEANRLANMVGACSPAANAAAKAAVNRGLEMPLGKALSTRYAEIEAFNGST